MDHLSCLYAQGEMTPRCEIKRKPSSPCPGQVTRAAHQPPRPLQAFHLTDFLYCFHDVLASSCSHLVAAHGKKLMGLFQLASAGFRHGNILRLWKSLYLWLKRSLCLFYCEVPCIPQMFLTVEFKVLQQLKKIFSGDICLSSPSHTWSHSSCSAGALGGFSRMT